MSDLATPHPSEIDGVSPEYRSFLETWGRHCGAPRGVFQGHLNGLIQAELRAAGHDVVAYLDQLVGDTRRTERALDRLLGDVTAFLASHDCVAANHADQGCPDGAALLDRIATARRVLGFEDATDGARQSQ
jgi:hypothetical protein